MKLIFYFRKHHQHVKIGIVYTSEPENFKIEIVYTSDPENVKIEIVYTSDTENIEIEIVYTSDTGNIEIEIVHTSEPKNVKIEIVYTSDPENVQNWLRQQFKKCIGATIQKTYWGNNSKNALGQQFKNVLKPAPAGFPPKLIFLRAGRKKINFAARAGPARPAKFIKCIENYKKYIKMWKI